MGSPKRMFASKTSPAPVLFAAHLTFSTYEYDAPLVELAEHFEIAKDEIEVLEVSLYERVFALWISKPQYCQAPEAIKGLIQRLESIYGVRKCVIQQQSIYFVNSADECVEVSCTRKEHLPVFKGVNIDDLTLSIFAGREYDAWCFMCYDTQNPFKEFSCRTAQRYWKRSSLSDGSWVCTIQPEDAVRKGCQQFTTLSKMLHEFGRPKQYFMLISKAFDNAYPYLVHVDGESICNSEILQPAFSYQIVSDASMDSGYVPWDKISNSEFADSEASNSSASSEDFWITPSQGKAPAGKRRHSLSFW